MTRKTKKRLAALVVVVVLVGLLGVLAVWGREIQQERRAMSAYERGTVAYDAGEYEAAMSDLGTYVAWSKTDPDALYRLADCRRRVHPENEQNLRMAVSIAREALALQPDDPRHYELLIELYPQIGFYNELRDVADRLRGLDPDHRGALDASVRASIMLDEHQDAIDAFDDWIQAHPDDVGARVGRVEVIERYLGQGQALAEAESLVSEYPDDARPHLILCLLHAADSDPEAAAAHLEAAAALQAPDEKTMRRVVEMCDRLEAIGVGDPARTFGQRAEDYLGAHGEHGTLTSSAYALGAVRAWKHGNEPSLDGLADMPVDDVSDDLLGWLAFVALAEQEDDGLHTSWYETLAQRDSSAAQAWIAVLDVKRLLDEDNLMAARERFGSSQLRAGAPGPATYLHAQMENEIGEWRSAADHLSAINASDPPLVSSHRVAGSDAPRQRASRGSLRSRQRGIQLPQG